LRRSIRSAFRVITQPALNTEILTPPKPPPACAETLELRHFNFAQLRHYNFATTPFLSIIVIMSNNEFPQSSI
ncbi:hypothetical protein, partial [Burkholderia multivorans]|uniref:hypothetical protein n=1 Tax=Burkholderia multivorans TaxID=87883 RepID=UPI0011B282E0